MSDGRVRRTTRRPGLSAQNQAVTPTVGVDARTQSAPISMAAAAGMEDRVPGMAEAGRTDERSP